MSEQLTNAENKLNDVFVKKAPYQIPEKSKKTLVEFMPWISLVAGLLGLLAAKALWSLGHYTNKLVDTINQISQVYGVKSHAPSLGVAYWLALVVLIGFSVLDVVAFPGLRAKSKARGWNLVFFGALLNVLYAMVLIFVDGRGVGSFIWGILTAIVSFYLLFQVRSQYK